MAEPERIEDVLFAELSLTPGKAFDGLAIGTFTAMMGEKIKITKQDLAAIVTNTKKVIQSTMSEGGELVGLPIDQDGHDRKGGAGWIVDVALSDSGDKILFTPKWTDLGEDLIRRSIRRFFSATFDLANKVIFGGSLTNWPASKNSMGVMALRPIELSENLKEITMPEIKEIEVVEPEIAVETPKGDTNMTEQVLEVETQPSETIQELLRTPEAVAELARRAQAMAEEFNAAETRKNDVVKFASRLVGGTKERPVGLAIRADEIVTVLLSLPEIQAAQVQKLLSKAFTAAIDFAEKGFEGSNYAFRPRLEGRYNELAHNWVNAGRTIKSFFSENPEVGNAEDFNLSEFEKKE